MFIYLLASILVISSQKTTAFRICMVGYAEHVTFSDYSNQSNDYFMFRFSGIYDKKKFLASAQGILSKTPSFI